MNGGGDTRVSLPTDVRKAVQEVKKTLGSKYSDEFVHTILKDCGVDPNEAGRRLKLIHDIREIAGKHSVEDVYTMLKDCNMDPNEAAQRLLYIDTFHEVKKKQDRRKPINGDTSEEFKRTRGNQWRGAKDGRGTFYASKVFDDAGGGRSLSSGKEFGVNNRLERLSRPVQTGKEDNMVNSGANANGTAAISNGSTDSHKLAPELLTVVMPDVSSSTSDPIVVSSHNTPHTCAVGTIKCEIVKRSSTSNARIPAGRRKFSADKVGGGTNPVIADSDNIRPPKSDVEKNQASESLQPLLLLTQKNTSDFVNPNQDNEPPKVAAFEKLTTPISHTNSLPEEESELKVLAPKLDVMLEKLTVSSPQPVIFPDHVQVPEIYRSRFTFGSLDVNTDDDSKPVSITESSKLDGEDVTLALPSLSNENASTTAQEGELQDNPLPENVLPSQDSNSSDSTIKHEETKPEIIPATVGFQNSVLQNTRDYGFGFMPQLMGPHFVQLDIPEVQNGSSPVASTLSPTPVTQSAIAAQSSIALSPHLFPYFRPFANYIPYNPYFPHMYLPQHAHLLNHGHGVFPQSSPHAGNVHMQAAAAAAAGGKFPTPSQNKQGGNEDVPASQAKENNNHSTVQQGEDPEVYAPAAGLDVPNLLPHYFYNFPQGHHMAYSPLQAAFYHSSQTMTAQSTVQPLLYQPQATGGTVEPMVQPPPTSHHASHINRNNTALLNGDAS